MTNRKKALLGASATIAVWATAFPFSKIALQSVDSLTLSVARVMGGALLMLVIGVVKGLHIPTTWREWGVYILLGATGSRRAGGRTGSTPAPGDTRPCRPSHRWPKGSQ